MHPLRQFLLYDKYHCQSYKNPDLINEKEGFLPEYFLSVGREITKTNKNIRNFKNETLTKIKKSFLQNRINVNLNIHKDILIDETSLERMTDL